MLFLIESVNRADRAAERQAARVAHLEFLRDSLGVITFGASASDLEDRNVGPVLIVDLPDSTAVDAFIRRDPYYTAGCYESVRILKLSQRVPEPSPGYFDSQIARERGAGKA
jgi:uncharacterized protein YciI